MSLGNGESVVWSAPAIHCDEYASFRFSVARLIDALTLLSARLLDCCIAVRNRLLQWLIVFVAHG